MKAGLLGTALLVASTLIAATNAGAQSAPPAPSSVSQDASRPMMACRSDVQALCKDITQEKGQRVQCLLSNKEKASPECQAALLKVEEQRSARKEQRIACRADVKSFCGTVEKGYAARVGCLKEHEAQLSPACKAALVQSPQASAAQ